MLETVNVTLLKGSNNFSTAHTFILVNNEEQERLVYRLKKHAVELVTIFTAGLK